MKIIGTVAGVTVGTFLFEFLMKKKSPKSARPSTVLTKVATLSHDGFNKAGELIARASNIIAVYDFLKHGIVEIVKHVHKFLAYYIPFDELWITVGDLAKPVWNIIISPVMILVGYFTALGKLHWRVITFGTTATTIGLCYYYGIPSIALQAGKTGLSHALTYAYQKRLLTA